MNIDYLKELEAVILERLFQGKTSDSYVAKLGKKGIQEMSRKVGEEALEVVIAANDVGLHNEEKTNDEYKKILVTEIADLWFHVMVLMAHTELSLEMVVNELKSRAGVSGVTEKLSRSF